jgi:hypothetical protein
LVCSGTNIDFQVKTVDRLGGVGNFAAKIGSATSMEEVLLGSWDGRSGPLSRLAASFCGSPNDSMVDWSELVWVIGKLILISKTKLLAFRVVLERSEAGIGSGALVSKILRGCGDFGNGLSGLAAPSRLAAPTRLAAARRFAAAIRLAALTRL